MKGFLEYWTEEVSLGEVEWFSSPESKTDSSGRTTVSTNATIQATAQILNPNNYSLSHEIGSAVSPMKSVRIGGTAAETVMSLASVTNATNTSISIAVSSVSSVPTPASLALEHKDFTVEFIPTRSENGLSSPKSEVLSFLYNTPPRMPLAVVKDSSGAFRWPQSGDRWDVSSQGPLYYAWPQDKAKSGGGNPADPDYAARFYIEDTGTGKWYPEPDYLEAGQTLAGSDGTVYNIYKYQPTGTNVTVYAEDGEGVRGAGIASGALIAITLDADGGTFGSGGGSSVTVYRAANSSLTGGDLDVPTKSGHYLSGWTANGTPVTFPYTVSGPVTFTAQWTVAASSGSGGGSGGSTPVVDPYSFYVNPSSGSDSNTGTQTSPFKTIQAAVDKIVAANDGTSAYSILLMDDVVDSSSGAYDSSKNFALVSIVSSTPLNLTIKSDSDGTRRTVNANRDATNTGRVMYVDANATITLRDVVLTGGYSADFGGGIHINGGTVSLDGATSVSNNRATTDGGGIYLSNGNVRLKGGSVSNNQASAAGGGMYVSPNTILEMSGGIISDNTSTGRGSAINLNGTLTMTGGTISGNGSQGIYAISAQAINLGGSAVIETDNDIQLGRGKYITVTSPLTGTVPVATISPSNYNVGEQVLAAGQGVTLANEVGKFAVEANGSDTYVVKVSDTDSTKGVLAKGIVAKGADAAVAISVLSGNETYTVRITGELTEEQITGTDGIKEELLALMASSPNTKIDLDLSGATLPSKTVPYESFNGCTNLVGITLPDSVTIIDEYAFMDCSSLTHVVIGNSVTKIGYRAFSGCSGLASVDIPDSVAEIGEYAFSDCSGLRTIDIPDSVTTIMSAAFENCSGLTRVVIGNSVTELSSTFSGCSSLVSVTIGNSVRIIGSYTFSRCSSLDSVVIPYLVTEIGDMAFQYCSNLKTIDIPDSVTKIGYAAFEFCTNLTSVKMRAFMPPELGGSVFEQNAGLQIQVPAGSLSDYQTEPTWQGYASYLVEY